VLGIAGFCYLTLVGVFRTLPSPNFKSLIVAVCSLVFVFLLVFFAGKSKAGTQIKQRIKTSSQKQKIVQWLVKLWHAIVNVRPLRLLNLTIMTLFIWMIHALSAYILLKAIQIQISIVLAIAIFAVAGISASIPISVDGVGLREGATFLLFKQLGLNGEAAITWAAMISVTSLFSRLLGAPLLLAMPLPWKKAFQRDEKKILRN
jgi:uncharacterized protein (TIRG00374 family)